MLAHHRTEGAGPPVIFLGGFRSDMTGTKAVHLEGWARAEGRAFLRFDYRGHGASPGAFEALGIEDWTDDARSMLEMMGRSVLVGSSMGGWIALRLARDLPDLVAGLVTVAAAPDFTDRMWAGFDAAQRGAIERGETVSLPSDYGDPYPISPTLLAQGRAAPVLDRPLPLPMPVRCLHGTADADVPVSEGLRLLGHADAADLRLTLVKGADHRFSEPDCLDLIRRAVTEVA